MIRTEKELIEMSKVYFKNLQVTHLFATTDGNFFLPERQNDCRAHATRNKLEMFKITADQVKPKPLEKEEQPKKGLPRKKGTK